MGRRVILSKSVKPFCRQGCVWSKTCPSVQSGNATERVCIVLQGFEPKTIIGSRPTPCQFEHYLSDAFITCSPCLDVKREFASSIFVFVRNDTFETTRRFSREGGSRLVIVTMFRQQNTNQDRERVYATKLLNYLFSQFFIKSKSQGTERI